MDVSHALFRRRVQQPEAPYPGWRITGSGLNRTVPGTVSTFALGVGLTRLTHRISQELSLLC